MQFQLQAECRARRPSAARMGTTEIAAAIGHVTMPVSGLLVMVIDSGYGGLGFKSPSRQIIFHD